MVCNVTAFPLTLCGPYSGLLSQLLDGSLSYFLPLFPGALAAILCVGAGWSVRMGGGNRRHAILACGCCAKVVRSGIDSLCACWEVHLQGALFVDQAD
eukprot:scaffold9967_cov20-Tisochrysis_lutea.AAC.1